MEVGGTGGGGNLGRTGARILLLLAMPLNAQILEELSRGPRRLSELRSEVGSPPQTTLRARLRELSETGAVARRRLNPFPSVREYELTNLPGRELLFVATTVEGWLTRAPKEPLSLDDELGRAAVKALVEGWSSTMLRALADGSASLAELDRRIGALSQPALQRRLEAMQRAGLVEASRDERGDTCYAVTEWLRQGTAPIAAAVRWERHHTPDDTTPIGPLDAEAGLLLTMPLLSLPEELSGTCRLGVEFGDGGDRYLAGVTVDVGETRVEACTTRLESSPSAWATGAPAAWLRTAIEADHNRLELGGDRHLVRGLLDGLNQALFAPVRPRL